MKRCFVLVGISGSGKSTYREQLIAQYDDVAILANDDVRAELVRRVNPELATNAHACFKYCRENEKEFNTLYQETKNECFTHQTVIVDSAVQVVKQRAKIYNFAKQHDYKVIAITFNVDIDTIKERQLRRGHKRVSNEIVTDMFFRMQSPLIGIDCDEIIDLV